MRSLPVLSALLGLLLVGCSGGGGDNSSSQTQQLQPIAVAITKTANGCLVSHNADAVIDYNYGVSPGPRNLLWSCASIPGHARVGVEAFYIYSGASSCHVERSFIFKAADCSARAIAPANPLLAARIEIVGSPSLVFIGSGTYAASVDVKVTNTGNLTLFGPSVDIGSNPLVFTDLFTLGDSPISGVGYLLPGVSIFHSGIPVESTNATSGEVFIFTAYARAMINDFVVLPLVSTTSNPVTAP